MGRITYDINTLIEGIKSRNRRILSKALSLTESQREEDRELAYKLIDKLYRERKHSYKIGITGPPGVGKSSFIEALGSYVAEDLNEQVAVIAIDPSSIKSGGSILGDRTRMQKLSASRNAFIRPAPTRGNLGGIAESTLFMIIIFEAAGFPFIIIETVGVGQNEYEIRNLSDIFILLLQPGAGDSLQGIKRGIMEMADMFIVTKADGNTKQLAKTTAQLYRQAIHLFPPLEHNLPQKILLTSIYDKKTIINAWDEITSFLKKIEETGYLASLRREQQQHWFNSLLNKHLLRSFYAVPEVKDAVDKFSEQVRVGEVSPFTAADEVIKLWLKHLKS